MNLNPELIGHGPIRVMALHDWTSTSETYAACQPYFDTERFTYALPDLRGYGASRAHSGNYSSQEIALDINDTAKALGWDAFHLIGHSMSGMPAQRVARESAGAIRSLILVTPVPASGVPADADARTMLEASAEDDASFVSVTKMMSSDRLPESWYRQKLAQQRSAIARTAYLGYLDMWTREDIAAQLGPLQTPALVLVGAHDFQFFALDNLRSRLGANLPAAAYEVLPDAGHYPMAETPLRFVRLIEDFMSAHA